MRDFIFQVLAGILGIWLAARFVPGVEFQGPIQILIAAGFILGLINRFIKPILNFITLPIRLLTFGLFGLVINMGVVFIVVDVLFPKYLEISGLLPLLWATIIIWGTIFIFSHPNRHTA